jgi:hypothetical protein
MNVIQAMQMVAQLKSNPMSLLSQRFNIPEGVNVNNPNDIIKHLIDTNQVSQNQIDQIKSQMGMK